VDLSSILAELKTERERLSQAIAFEPFPSAEQFLKSGRNPHQSGDPICSIQHFGSGLRCFCIIRARVPQCFGSLVRFVYPLVARMTESD
jgi:hypothetical protein